MKASELVKRIQSGIAKHGDMDVYQGDMEAVQLETVVAEQPEVYGHMYLHLGDY
ncbi:MAG TPA: hypothetical protein VGJ93_14730 [Desulfuromonadaceae bacterium]